MRSTPRAPLLPVVVALAACAAPAPRGSAPAARRPVATTTSSTEAPAPAPARPTFPVPLGGLAEDLATTLRYAALLGPHVDPREDVEVSFLPTRSHGAHPARRPEPLTARVGLENTLAALTPRLTLRVERRLVCADAAPLDWGAPLDPAAPAPPSESDTTIVASGAPLEGWLRLLSADLGEALRVEGPLTGRVTARLRYVDVAQVRSATLALWRCQAERAPDGALVVRQTTPAPDPTDPRPPTVDAPLRFDAALAAGDDEALHAATRALDPHAASVVVHRLPRDAPLDRVLPIVVTAAHHLLRHDLDAALLRRDADGAREALRRLQHLHTSIPRRLDRRDDPWLAPLREQLAQAVSDLRYTLANLHLRPDATLTAPHGSLVRVDTRVVSLFDVVPSPDAQRPPARLVQVETWGAWWAEGEARFCVSLRR